MTLTTAQASSIESWLRGTALEPENPITAFKLGAAYADAHQLFAARLSLLRATELCPTYAEAWSLLGEIYWKQNDISAALDALGKAVSLTPSYESTRERLTALCQQKGLAPATLAPWPQPLVKPHRDTDDWQLHPSQNELELRALISAHGYDDRCIIKLAVILFASGRNIEAESMARFVLSCDPENTNALLALSSIAQHQGRVEDALNFAMAATDSMPEHPLAAVQALSFSLAVCAWGHFAQLKARALQALSVVPGAAQPAEALFFVDDPATLAACGQALANTILAAAPRDQVSITHAPATRNTQQRLTIGYISADFHFHPMGRLIAELISHHTRGEFMIRAYSVWASADNPVRDVVRTACDSFVELHGLEASTAAEKIAADKVDILIDMTGYTLNSRTDILAQRPAPIQVCFAGYLGTMGAKFIDYQISDMSVAANPESLCTTESLVRLPHSMLAGDRHCFAGKCEAVSRVHVGLPTSGVVFCNFSDLNRLNPDVFAIWMRILKRVPGSVLWMVDRSPESKQRLLQQVVGAGVNSSRIIFSKPTSYENFLQRLTCADLMLDTLPHNAGAVGLDALWMGCPVLTCAGAAVQARIGAGMVRAAGIPEMAVTSLSEYEETAVRLGSAPATLAEIKHRLIQARDHSPLFDAPRMTRHLEWAYRAMWERHTKELPPDLIDVPELA